MQLRFMQKLAALYTYLRSRRLATRRKPRSAWVFPRPQNWFEELLTNRAVDFWWKENFRVSRVTFDRICHLVGPALERQNTRFPLYSSSSSGCEDLLIAKWLESKLVLIGNELKVETNGS